MKALTVRTQLVLAFGSLIGALLLVSVLALHSQNALNERFSGFVTGIEQRGSLVADVRSQANRRAIAVRDMMLVRTDADRELAKATVTEANDDLHANLKQLQAAVAAASDVSAHERELLDAVVSIEARYEPLAIGIVELTAAGKHDEAIAKINSDCRPLLAQLLAAATEYVSYSREAGAQALDATAADYLRQRDWLIALCSLASIAAMSLGGLLTHRLTTALGAEPAVLGAIALRVAKGDLSAVSGAATAPADSVLGSMGAMQQQLVELIGQVRASAHSIATASNQIAQGNNDLSGRTEEQASALEETASSMEELGSSVEQNAGNAKHADQLAQNASAVAVQGGDVVGQVVDTMKGIAASSKKIADIIGVIDTIAFQTNLLALNAAVEAARAGEQGRGFAVVASEVRALAGRSAQAAKEIKSLITDSVGRVEIGSELVDRAGTTMSEIVEAIKRVTGLVSEISIASSEQAMGVGQVGQAITQMDQTTQQNAALVEQSAAAAQELQNQAQQLVRAITAFKFSGDTAAAAVAQKTAVTPGFKRSVQSASHAKNVVRADFRSAPRPGSSRARDTAAPLPKTGTDWSEF